ncbi:hypothetical protein M0804_004451 [Polistes exclamans]|nr:hypothetical protein M0804_004451 [Polistes exclamans]
MNVQYRNDDDEDDEVDEDEDEDEDDIDIRAHPYAATSDERMELRAIPPPQLTVSRVAFTSVCRSKGGEVESRINPNAIELDSRAPWWGYDRRVC